MRKKSLILNKCEIDTCEETECLHLHHIIPRTDPETSNNLFNLCIVCPNCHSKIHAGKLKILGIIPSTKLPNKRTVIYEVNGKRNIDIEIPKAKFKSKYYKIFGEQDAD